MWLVESLLRTVTEADDPASHAATVDICALSVHRSQNVTPIEEWLRSENGRRRMFAVAVVRSIELSSFGSSNRQRVCSAFVQALGDLASAQVKLTPGEAQWLEMTLRAELAKCA
jgi:erythromycin esterase-like protein